MTRVWIKITVLLVLAVPRIAAGQSGGQDERGIPFPNEHYAPPEYEHDPQNWDIVQDDRGLIYVANNDGVLQYDGERWRLIPTNTGTFVRSLAADSLVYVGVKGDFGYLRPDSLGRLQYTSLYEHIPEDERDFEDVWRTHVLSDGVYYQANQRLFRWDGEKVTSWSSEEGFHTSFVVDGTLYVRDFERGLLRMRNGSLELVSGGEAFHEVPIYMMARHPSGNLIIGTQNRGLLLKDDETFRSFASELTPYLQENDLYHGCRLPGNRYALATMGGGVIIIDGEGQVVRMLDNSSGLPDPFVNHVYADRDGQLWMALNNEGVFRVGLNAPLTVHDERTGLDGTVQDIHKHRDTTYVATGSGLYVLREQENQVLGEQSAYFERWENENKGTLPLILDMVSVESDLMVGTEEKGIYLVDRHGKEEVEGVGWNFTYELLEIEEDSVIYAGTRSGLKGLRQTPDGWTSFSVEGVRGEIRTLSVEEYGTLWASTSSGSVLRIILSADGRRATATTRYDEQDGLPQGHMSVTMIDGQATVYSKDGLFQINNPSQSPESWQFTRRSSLLPDIAQTDTPAVEAIEETGERLWAVLGGRVFVGQMSQNDTYDWTSIEPLHFPKSKRTPLTVSQDSTVWLGDGLRLFRYEWGRRDFEQPSADFSALVRQVRTLRKGRVVYEGSGSVLNASSSLTIPYGQDLRIEVAAPLYSSVEPHEYRYKLGGRSDQWSDWTSQAHQGYRNLWEGTYQFRVQARNDRGEVSKPASLTVTIPPPWYRSTWAYLFYGLAFVAVSFGYRRYSQIKEENRRAQERVRELERERVVAERLKKANERLREANRLKEDFLATTSHELRTPLTNILGALEVLRDMVGGEQKQFLDMIEQNGQRLKRTLNALLDLSMLRSGSEDVKMSPTSLNECIHQVASDLKDDAEEKGLSLRVDTPDPPVQANVDEQYLEQILRNLVENAIKYTHEGHVVVSAGRGEGHVFVEVEDTGIGIDEEFLPSLFEEFKQESRGRARAYEGNGLGLAISARLAEQMDGTIHVETEKNQGSTFTVRFPSSGEVSTERAVSEVGEA